MAGNKPDNSGFKSKGDVRKGKSKCRQMSQGEK